MAVIETVTADNLLIAGAHKAAVGTVVLTSGQGKVTRGTVLARNASTNKFLVLDTPGQGVTQAAEVIVATDADATSADAVVEVYVSGDFNKDFITVASGYTMTGADEVDLKNAGIYLYSGITF